MTALRWTRRSLDAILLVALVAVALTAGIVLLAPVTGGRTMVIGGGSMEPSIPRGSIVLATPADRYGVSDVVAVQQGGATPYTHRISRLAELKGVPHVETKGDANEAPDPAIVPTASIIGRVDVSLPYLGYLALLLGNVAGLVGFVALGGSLLLASGALEEWENSHCPICAAQAAAGMTPIHGLDGAAPTSLDGPTALAGPAALAASAAIAGAPTPAASHARPREVTRMPAVTRVRENGRARDPRAPVLLERDRRNPRRHGIATAPEPPAPATTPPAVTVSAAVPPAFTDATPAEERAA